MAKSQDSFLKKEKEKKRRQKNAEKLERKEQRKAEKSQAGPKTLEEMFSYVDENGFLTSVKPNPDKKVKIIAQTILLGAKPRDTMPEDAQRDGVVRFFNTDKGYGFITDTLTRESIFFHINSVNGVVRENAAVVFEIELGPKGHNAINVRLKD